MHVLFSLNGQLWRQKRRYANLVLLLQAFAFILIFVIVSLTIGYGNNILLFFYPITSLRTAWAGTLSSLAIVTTVIADLIFAGLMAWQNERIDNSQTFQLLPLSTDQLWLVNIFSSLLACGYIFLIQVTISWLLSLPSMILIMKINPWSSLISFLLGLHSSEGNVFEALIPLIGLALLVFTAVSFVNFTSKIMADFLPLKNSRWLRLILIAIISVIGIYLALQINGRLISLCVHNVYIPHKNGGEEIIGNPERLENIELWVYVVVIGGIDLWLGQKFWEPRRDQ